MEDFEEDSVMEEALMPPDGDFDEWMSEFDDTECAPGWYSDDDEHDKSPPEHDPAREENAFAAAGRVTSTGVGAFHNNRALIVGDSNLRLQFGGHVTQYPVRDMTGLSISTSSTSDDNPFLTPICKQDSGVYSWQSGRCFQVDRPSRFLCAERDVVRSVVEMMLGYENDFFTFRLLANNNGRSDASSGNDANGFRESKEASSMNEYFNNNDNYDGQNTPNHEAQRSEFVLTYTASQAYLEGMSSAVLRKLMIWFASIATDLQKCRNFARLDDHFQVEGKGYEVAAHHRNRPVYGNHDASDLTYASGGIVNTSTGNVMCTMFTAVVDTLTATEELLCDMERALSMDPYEAHLMNNGSMNGDNNGKGCTLIGLVEKCRGWSVLFSSLSAQVDTLVSRDTLVMGENRRKNKVISSPKDNTLQELSRIDTTAVRSDSKYISEAVAVHHDGALLQEIMAVRKAIDITTRGEKIGILGQNTSNRSSNMIMSAHTVRTRTKATERFDDVIASDVLSSKYEGVLLGPEEVGGILQFQRDETPDLDSRTGHAPSHTYYGGNENRRSHQLLHFPNFIGARLTDLLVGWDKEAVTDDHPHTTKTTKMRTKPLVPAYDPAPAPIQALEGNTIDKSAGKLSLGLFSTRNIFGTAPQYSNKGIAIKAPHSIHAETDTNNSLENGTKRNTSAMLAKRVVSQNMKAQLEMSASLSAMQLLPLSVRMRLRVALPLKRGVVLRDFQALQRVHENVIALVKCTYNYYHDTYSP
jgi:hypothetical protein